MEIARSQSAHLPPLTEKKFAVIGQDTAYALREYGIEPDLIPADETSEGLFDALKNTYSLEGLRIFFPRSALPNPFLKDHLTAAGARVHEMPIYDNTQPDHVAPLPAERIDRVIFTSPSTVHNFLSIYGPIPKEWAILAKGERTQRELKLEGYESEIVII
jgi:uroporphyrinogen-III synthase